jgi:hypothetical protein
MHEPQQNLRNAASRAFMESLDQLQNILAQESQTAESDSQQEGNSINESIPQEPVLRQSTDRGLSSWTYLKALEEAAADIDNFFGDNQPPEAGVLDEEVEG